MKLEYIDNVYDTEALKKSDSGIYDKIQRKINACSGIVPREYSKTKAQKNFRGINSYQVIPRVIYEEMDNNGVLEDIETQINGNDMEAKILGKNKLMQYVVSVSKRMNYYSANEYMDKLDIKLTPQDYEFDEEVEYTIVGSAEADPMNFKISNESPVGSALIGKKVGDVVEVAVPSGMSKFEVLEIRRD